MHGSSPTLFSCGWPSDMAFTLFSFVTGTDREGGPELRGLVKVRVQQSDHLFDRRLI